MSAFAKVGVDLIGMGYSCMPILPGEKRPGRYVNNNWVGLSNWQKYCSQLPSTFETSQWEQWPGAGVGIALGEKSGVVGGDLDYGSPEVRAAIESILPPSPVPCQLIGAPWVSLRGGGRGGRAAAAVGAVGRVRRRRTSVEWQ